MKRRTFVTTLAASLGIISFDAQSQDNFDLETITGRKNLALYGKNYRLRKSANESFIKMVQAAEQAGFKVSVISSYRSFDDQKRIWNRKYNRFTNDGLTPIQAIYKIIEYSTVPGTSRHHWGTDIDIIDGNQAVEGDVLLPQLFHDDGPFAAFKTWLNDNADHYGFIEVYTSDNKRKGFKYEPWHFSYAPLSVRILKAYQKLNLPEFFSELAIEGSQYFDQEFIQKYWDENIMDINPLLKP